jgi:IS1 family transposase
MALYTIFHSAISYVATNQYRIYNKRTPRPMCYIKQQSNTYAFSLFFI